MSTVTIPDDLVEKLRAHEEDEQLSPSELVARAVVRYLSLCRSKQLSRAEAERLMRRAEERRAALESVGITEEDIVEDFERWRHRQQAGR
jgi:hypothetical protein